MHQKRNQIKYYAAFCGIAITICIGVLLPHSVWLPLKNHYGIRPRKAWFHPKTQCYLLFSGCPDESVLETDIYCFTITKPADLPKQVLREMASPEQPGEIRQDAISEQPGEVIGVSWATPESENCHN